MKRAASPTPLADDDSPFALLVDDMVQVIACHLVRPADYRSFLLVSRATARLLTAPSLRLMMTKRYFDPWRWVMENAYRLDRVDEQTPELCLAAIREQPSALQFVRAQTRDLCLVALELDPVVLWSIRLQTPELCLAAVRKQCSALYHVDEQTHDICLAAVPQDGMNFRFVQNPTSDVYMAAIHQNPHVAQYMCGWTSEIRDVLAAQSTSCPSSSS
jgi:hypothetical protein